MKTYSALFAGFDLAGHGLQSAGLEPIDLFEFDPGNPKLSGAIADIGAANTTGRYIRRDVCEVDWMQFERPDFLWASPVCKNASIANSDGEESGADIATAEATCGAIRVWKPKVVCIENVWGYRKFEAFEKIRHTLRECGYSFDFWHLNAADYGVPQTRRRLILIAIHGRGLRITKPPATHHDPRRIDAEQGSLFGPETLPWVGWYEAIEDLIPALPESQFAQWQLDRLPDHINFDFLQMTCNTQKENPSGKSQCRSDSPSNTVVATTHALRSRAFLVDDQTSHAGSMASRIDAIEPALTVSTRHGGGTTPRAFICHDTEMRYTPVRTVGLDCPDRLIPSANGRANGNMPRVFILDGQNGGREISLRCEREPFLTLTSQNKGTYRGFIANGDMNNRGESMTTRDDREHRFTVVAQHGTRQAARAWLQHGRVVKMTARALGRFQTLPDSFQLSGRDSVDCAGIGNGVSCRLATAIAQHVQTLL